MYVKTHFNYRKGKTYNGYITQSSTGQGLLFPGTLNLIKHSALTRRGLSVSTELCRLHSLILACKIGLLITTFGVHIGPNGQGKAVALQLSLSAKQLWCKTLHVQVPLQKMFIPQSGLEGYVEQVSLRFILQKHVLEVTAVCIMIDRSQKIVECDFPSPLIGFGGFESEG